jgi:RND family efflux transporter MFP subunit
MPAAPPSIDPESSVWRDFAQARTPEDFYRGWLALQCRMLPGACSAVVIAGSPAVGRFAPVAAWPDRQSVQHLAEVAEKALAQRHGVVLRRQRNGASPEDGPAAATRVSGERYDVAYPIEVEGKLYGVVAVELEPHPDRNVDVTLRQLQWGAGWLEVLVHRLTPLRVDPASAEGARLRLQTVLDLVASALGHDRFYGATTSFATTLATRLACDRVSVGFVTRGRARVRGVSHSAQFGKQTNLIRAIEAVMDEALDQGATVLYPARGSDAARVTRAHEELSRQHGSGAVCTVPLAEGGRLVGALTLERSGGTPFEPATLELCEAVAAVAGPVLELQRRDDRWLAAKAFDHARRHLGAVIGPAHVALKLGVVGAVAVVAFLVLAKADYRVSARTTIEAGVRRAAVAPFNGYIRQAPVRAGDLVREGDLLVMLDDRELKLERLKWLAQQDQLARQYQQALAKREAAQVNIFGAQVEQARAQLALIEEQLARTRVVAGFGGIVVTGDLSQSLNAPVERGQVLFEIAPLDEYRVVAQVDERDIADIKVGQPGQLLLTAWPTEVLPFQVRKLTPVSIAREGRNYFRVEGKLDRTPERLRPGMEGVGKVTIDRRLLVWIWTRQAIDWVRLKLWTWWP